MQQPELTLRYPPMTYLIPLAARTIVLRIIVISSLWTFLINLIFGGGLISGGESGVGSVFIGLSIISVPVLLHHILRWVSNIGYTFTWQADLPLSSFCRLWPRKNWSVRSDLIYSAAEFIVGKSKHINRKKKVLLTTWFYIYPSYRIPHSWNHTNSQMVY